MFPGPSVSHDRHSDNPVKKSKGSRHKTFFRRLVLVVVIVAILVIWKLRFVIVELGNLQHELESWTGARTILATFVSYIFTHIAHLARHIWISTFH